MEDGNIKVYFNYFQHIGWFADQFNWHTQLGQSMAIARYLARKAKIDGVTDTDFSTSEMMIEEANDIYDIFVKVRAIWSTPCVTHTANILSFIFFSIEHFFKP